MTAVQIDVKHVAHLARLHLTPEEEQKFGVQLTQVLDYVRKLEELDVSNTEPTAHAASLLNVTRPDHTRPCLSHHAAMHSAPAQANGLFIVPKIVE